MTGPPTLLEKQEDLIEHVGEAELIGNWAEVTLEEAFAKRIEVPDYQVFVSSYDPVLLFVQNRTLRAFEIHTVPISRARRPFEIRCCYRVVARGVRLSDGPG